MEIQTMFSMNSPPGNIIYLQQGMFKLLTMYYLGVKGFFLVLLLWQHLFGRIWTLYSSSPCAHSYKILIRSRKTLLSYLSKNFSFAYEIFELATVAVITYTYKYWGELRTYVASYESGIVWIECIFRIRLLSESGTIRIRYRVNRALQTPWNPRGAELSKHCTVLNGSDIIVHNEFLNLCTCSVLGGTLCTGFLQKKLIYPTSSRLCAFIPE